MMFTVPGEIRGKARPRFTKVGRAYTDAKTKAYERKIATAFRAAGGESLGDSPVKLLVLAKYPVPKSETKANKLLMWLSKLFPTKKPDIDNIAKVVMDALNGLAYDDDNQVTDLIAHKRYVSEHGEPGLLVIVEKVEP